MERGDASPPETSAERDDLLRLTLVTIQGVKELGVSPLAARRLDTLAEALMRDLRPEVPAPGSEPRKFGAFAQAFTIGPEFFEPLSDDELRAWGEA